MRHLKLILILILVLATSFIFSQKFQNGDVIFIKNKKIGASLIPNGKTKFNYVGVVFIENGVPMVYHATEPVSSTGIEDFVNLSENKEFKIRRLYERELLNNDVVATMRSFARAKLQMHYDNKLTLNNDELYNAEFVYKMYQQCLGIPLTKPKTLDNYKSEVSSLEFLKEAYGDAILTEKLVVIGDIYNSEFMMQPEKEE
jgi:hypothetical protein